MTTSQEEAFFNFLDNVIEAFNLDDVVSFIRKIDPTRINRLSAEIEAYLNYRNLAFPEANNRWISRQGCFGPVSFAISPTRLELLNGILIPGHRCVPFANTNLLPQEYIFYWQGCSVPFTTTEGPPEEFYPYYSIFGEEYAPQYVARDNDENEEAFNSDPYDDPPEVSIKTLDMRNIYRETAFVPGDRFVVQTLDWKTGEFELEKIGRDTWKAEDLQAWFEAAEKGFHESFNKLGPAASTEEQIAYAYWYGGSRMREVPAYALEEYLYEKTDSLETAAYGIETRFWYLGREIPDLKKLDTEYTRPDKTPIEEMLNKVNIPVSEYLIHSYVYDSLYRQEAKADLVMERLVPAVVELESLDRSFLTEYIESCIEELREDYSPFTDKVTGSIRQRAIELHTAVIELAARLNKGDIDTSWLPRHTFIILSQIQSHTAGVLEDLDSDEPLSESEIEAIDGSLDSMIETYDDLKELIDEAIKSYRRNRLAVIRPGSSSDTVTERLIQLSIGGIDVWRRMIINETITMEELHQIIQMVFGWRNTQTYRFSAEKPGEKISFETDLDPNTRIKDMEARNISELFYEYGTKWTVRIMILSRYETQGSKPVRCVAGAGAAPPEFINGSVKFRKILNALESGNDLERLNARQELGPEFVPGEFDLEACNRNLKSRFIIKDRGPDKTDSLRLV